MDDNKKYFGIAALCFAIAFLYLVVPIDFIPDIVAGIGWLDDAVIGLCGLAGIALNIFWALGVLPAPGGNNYDDYEDEEYSGETYGNFREV